MSPAWQIILGMLGPVLLLVGVVITARVTRKGGHEAAQVSLAKEIRAWTELRLAERDKRIDSLEEDVRELRAELDELARKYRAAITYIRRLVTQLRRHVSPEQIEPPPPEIQIDL